MEMAGETGRRATGLAQQLRVLHNELADQGLEMRVEQMRDCVQRELSSLPPHEREGFIKDLTAQFPTWDSERGSIRVAAPAPVAAAPKSASALTDSLIAMWSGLSGGERTLVVSKLAAAGLVASEPGSGQTSSEKGEVREVVREVIKEVVREVPTLGGLPEAAMLALKKEIGLPPEAVIRADRVVELCTVLAEFTVKLEPWAVSYWQEMSKDSKSQVFRVLSKPSPNERQGVLARYAEGDETLSRESLLRDMLRLRSLVSLLLKGVLKAGEEFSKDHMKRYAVDVVQSSAEKGTFTESQGAKNWKQYIKLMEGVDAAAMEKRLKSMIAKDVESGLSHVMK